MSLSKDEVKYIASLSRIHLTDAEVEKFAKDLGAVLEFVEKLKTLNVEGVKPTSHVLELQNVYREDIVKKSLSQDEALSIAVAKEKGAFKVPQVIE